MTSQNKIVEEQKVSDKTIAITFGDIYAVDVLNARHAVTTLNQDNGLKVFIHSAQEKTKVEASLGYYDHYAQFKNPTNTVTTQYRTEIEDAIKILADRIQNFERNKILMNSMFVTPAELKIPLEDLTRDQMRISRSDKSFYKLPQKLFDMTTERIARFIGNQFMLLLAVENPKIWDLLTFPFPYDSAEGSGGVLRVKVKLNSDQTDSILFEKDNKAAEEMKRFLGLQTGKNPDTNKEWDYIFLVYLTKESTRAPMNVDVAFLDNAIDEYQNFISPAVFKMIGNRKIVAPMAEISKNGGYNYFNRVASKSSTGIPILFSDQVERLGMIVRKNLSDVYVAPGEPHMTVDEVKDILRIVKDEAKDGIATFVVSGLQVLRKQLIETAKKNDISTDEIFSQENSVLRMLLADTEYLRLRAGTHKGAQNMSTLPNGVLAPPGTCTFPLPAFVIRSMLIQGSVLTNEELELLIDEIGKSEAFKHLGSMHVDTIEKYLEAADKTSIKLELDAVDGDGTLTPEQKEQKKYEIKLSYARKLLNSHPTRNRKLTSYAQTQEVWDNLTKEIKAYKFGMYTDEEIDALKTGNFFRDLVYTILNSEKPDTIKSLKTGQIKQSSRSSVPVLQATLLYIGLGEMIRYLHSEKFAKRLNLEDRCMDFSKSLGVKVDPSMFELICMTVARHKAVVSVENFLSLSCGAFETFDEQVMSYALNHARTNGDLQAANRLNIVRVFLFLTCEHNRTITDVREAQDSISKWYSYNRYWDKKNIRDEIRALSSDKGENNETLDSGSGNQREWNQMGSTFAGNILPDEDTIDESSTSFLDANKRRRRLFGAEIPVRPYDFGSLTDYMSDKEKAGSVLDILDKKLQDADASEEAKLQELERAKLFISKNGTVVKQVNDDDSNAVKTRIDTELTKLSAPQPTITWPA